MTNQFYEMAFDTDFASAQDQEELQKAFRCEIDSIVSAAHKQLIPIASITSVVEIFHYSVLAAAFIQQKATLRANEIYKSAPAEDSVYTTVLSQLAGYQKNEEEADAQSSSLGEYAHHSMYDLEYDAQDFADVMSARFEFSGSAMRSFTITCLLYEYSCPGNALLDSGTILTRYKPTELLTREARFPVIGTISSNLMSSFNSSIRVPNFDSTVYTVDRCADSGFCRIFGEKLVELLASTEKMAYGDRARLEEIRTFALEVISSTFLGIRSYHLMRVFHLLIAMSQECDEGYQISEHRLNSIVPCECTELLRQEAVVTKASVDTTRGVCYKPNAGIRGLAKLIEKYSLLDGHKLLLLRDAVDAIKK